MEKAVIIGAGAYGQVYAEYLRESYKLIGFIDDDKLIWYTEIKGIKVLGDMEYLFENIASDVNVFVPIGDTNVKVDIFERVRAKGFSTPNYIHPTANIHPSVRLGEHGVYILQGTIVMPLATIENDVMISSGTTITHHAIIEQGAFISFGVNVGASLVIREKAYLGIGCTIMTGIKTVGRGALIGAGAVIIHDVPAGATVVGNPGRVIKK